MRAGQLFSGQSACSCRGPWFRADGGLEPSSILQLSFLTLSEKHQEGPTRSAFLVCSQHTSSACVWLGASTHTILVCSRGSYFMVPQIAVILLECSSLVTDSTNKGYIRSSLPVTPLAESHLLFLSSTHCPVNNQLSRRGHTHLHVSPLSP